MSKKAQQTFVGMFIEFLNQKIGMQSFTPLKQQSIQVAVQCLEDAFNIYLDMPKPETALKQAASNTASSSAKDGSITDDMNQINLFELFQWLFIQHTPQLSLCELGHQFKRQGDRHFRHNRMEQALHQYHRAIMFDPKNPLYYCKRARTLTNLGRYTHAIADCKTAISYNVDCGKAYDCLGTAYSKLNMHREALQCYQRAVVLDSTNLRYKRHLQRSQMASLTPVRSRIYRINFM